MNASKHFDKALVGINFPKRLVNSFFIAAVVTVFEFLAPETVAQEQLP